MARSPEKNALVREARKAQILDAALCVYIRCGYHGTDMDTVAEKASLAKGLLYYYYKTKKDLFAELFVWMFNEEYAFSSTLLERSAELSPVEQLMYYAYGMFAANNKNTRMMQFYIRIPFDAFAIFGQEWKDGEQKSVMHQRALASIIERGIAQDEIPQMNPVSAANSFWSVFVANTFNIQS